MPNMPTLIQTHTEPSVEPYVSGWPWSAAIKTPSWYLATAPSWFFWPGSGSILPCLGQSETEVRVKEPVGCWDVGWEVVLRTPQGSWEQINTHGFHTQMTTLWGQRSWWSTAGCCLKAEDGRGKLNQSRLFLSRWFFISAGLGRFRLPPLYCLHFRSSLFFLSLFLVSPWRAGMRGEIISVQALHHYLLSDKPLGHSITFLLSLLHCWEEKKEWTKEQDKKI